jgi:3D (Asp-Asp-Asp) domain-containing protein
VRFLKKYNKVTGMMFWVLFFAVISASVWVIAIKGESLSSLFMQSEEEVQEEIMLRKDPIVIKEIQTQTLEWYYFVATGYSANDPSQGTDSKTFTGKKVYEGVIAVDPDIIPLGSLVEIKDIGLFVADDIGGKIKGNRVDIFFTSKEKAIEFGRQEIWLRMVEDTKNVQLAEVIEY